MKNVFIHISFSAIATCFSAQGVFSQIQFQLGPAYLEAIHVTENIEFSVGTGGSDASLNLVLKDAYQSETKIPGYNVSDSQIFSNATATLNGNISSDASWFASFVDGAPDFPSGIDIEATDILMLFEFLSYDPYTSPWLLTIGDTITIESGTILDLSDFDIPNPDNLSSQITAQIFSSNFPIVFTDEQTLAVVPESRMIAVGMGLFALSITLLKRRHRTSRSSQFLSRSAL